MHLKILTVFLFVISNSSSLENDIEYFCTAAKVAEVPKTVTAEERTLIIVKPDGVQRGLVGEVLRRYEAKGLKLIAIKMVRPSRELLAKHYEDLKDESFFEDVLDYMSSGPIVPTVWEGYRAVKYGRQILGSSRTIDSASGTIRGDLCVSDVQDIIHGADSVEAANREINLWFNETELMRWTQANVKFIHGYD